MSKQCIVALNGQNKQSKKQKKTGQHDRENPTRNTTTKLQEQKRNFYCRKKIKQARKIRGERRGSIYDVW